MENAVDALKIAFAVLIFVIALTITFSIISQAKSTADAVLFYNDKTNLRTEKVAIENANGGKKVGIAEVISTINRCKTENLSVTVKDSTGEYVFDKADNKKYINASDLTNEIYKFIKQHTGDVTYREYFSEVVYSGTYIVEEGITLVEASGSSKIYITYEEE